MRVNDVRTGTMVRRAGNLQRGERVFLEPVFGNHLLWNAWPVPQARIHGGMVWGSVPHTVIHHDCVDVDFDPDDY